MWLVLRRTGPDIVISVAIIIYKTTITIQSLLDFIQIPHPCHTPLHCKSNLSFVHFLCSSLHCLFMCVLVSLPRVVTPSYMLVMVRPVAHLCLFTLFFFAFNSPQKNNYNYNREKTGVYQCKKNRLPSLNFCFLRVTLSILRWTPKTGGPH